MIDRPKTFENNLSPTGDHEVAGAISET